MNNSEKNETTSQTDRSGIIDNRWDFIDFDIADKLGLWGILGQNREDFLKEARKVYPDYQCP